jgi:uncharacterized protein YaiL (DUF2058 family)
MLDLKAKLLAAGVVTADQVKKVEDEEALRRQRAKERRDAEERRRADGPPGDRRGPRSPQEARRDHRRDERRDDRGDARRDDRGDARREGASAGRPPDGRRDRRDEDPDEKRARREHEWNEAQRWRQRLEQLKGAGKSEQYEAIRGWVMRDRVDNRQITEAATRFHFVKHDGSVGHLTVEPDVQASLAAGGAAVVAFMGYNGLEHAVVPRDVADDVRAVRPDWLRHLVGVTDVAPEAGAADGETLAGATPALEASGAAPDDDGDSRPPRDDAPADDDVAAPRDDGSPGGAGLPPVDDG